jgi:acylphosphatase
MTARSIGVTGWVRNRADGSVEVYAEGAPEALQRFEQYLHEGPPTAHVERVDSSHPEPGGEHRSFRVAH